LKLLPGKYDVLHVYCRTHFSAWCDVHISFLHQRLLIDHV
jgi:hypothetical protein